MHKPSKLMSIVECYQACHAFVTRASEIVDILNAMNHRASKYQMMAATTIYIGWLTVMARERAETL